MVLSFVGFDISFVISFELPFFLSPFISNVLQELFVFGDHLGNKISCSL